MLGLVLPSISQARSQGRLIVNSFEPDEHFWPRGWGRLLDSEAPAAESIGVCIDSLK